MKNSDRPVSARWAADCLARLGANAAVETPRCQDEAEPSAGELERRELVRDLAEQVTALRAQGRKESAEIEIRLRLLDHLSRPMRLSWSCPL